MNCAPFPNDCCTTAEGCAETLLRREIERLNAMTDEMLALLKTIARGIERGKLADGSLIRRGGDDEVEIYTLSSRLAEVIGKVEAASITLETAVGS